MLLEFQFGSNYNVLPGKPLSLMIYLNYIGKGSSTKKLYDGDNLDILRKFIKDETDDLCYIDPPFNS